MSAGNVRFSEVIVTEKGDELLYCFWKITPNEHSVWDCFTMFITLIRFQSQSFENCFKT